MNRVFGHDNGHLQPLLPAFAYSPVEGVLELPTRQINAWDTKDAVHITHHATIRVTHVSAT